MDARLSTPRIELVSSDTGPQLQFTVTDSLTGVAVLSWQSTDLDRAAGDYEGELETVLSDGTRQTVYDTIQFRLREDFA